VPTPSTDFVINARLNPYMRAPPKDTEELPAINEKGKSCMYELNVRQTLTSYPHLAIKGDALSHHTV
jgi:hypothetical protein